MSFRKRNTVIGGSGTPSSHATRLDDSPAVGTRPSPLDGRFTTSTGTQSLDQLLAGHAGLPLGSSLLIEETGTTDFGGILLRYYAAEGLVQGHHVHLLGPGSSWRRELPGLSLEPKPKPTKRDPSADSKMKIAWRYETLSNRPATLRDEHAPSSPSIQGAAPFCHTFDLGKRLENNAAHGKLHLSTTGDPLAGVVGPSYFQSFIAAIKARLKESPPSSIHRIIIPNLLSPTLYNSSACYPREVLQFLHALRGLLRLFPAQLTVMVTLPISLFPRSTGLTRWIELLFDGVIELIPLQTRDRGNGAKGSSNEDKAQGLLRVHGLPAFHEKGGGPEGGWVREDLSFRLSASSGMIITPFSLPPVGDEGNNPENIQPAEGVKTQGLDF